MRLGRQRYLARSLDGARACTCRCGCGRRCGEALSVGAAWSWSFRPAILLPSPLVCGEVTHDPSLPPAFPLSFSFGPLRCIRTVLYSSRARLWPSCCHGDSGASRLRCGASDCDALWMSGDRTLPRAGALSRDAALVPPRAALPRRVVATCGRRKASARGWLAPPRTVVNAVCRCVGTRNPTPRHALVPWYKTDVCTLTMYRPGVAFWPRVFRSCSPSRFHVLAMCGRCHIRRCSRPEQGRALGLGQGQTVAGAIPMGNPHRHHRRRTRLDQLRRPRACFCGGYPSTWLLRLNGCRDCTHAHHAQPCTSTPTACTPVSRPFLLSCFGSKHLCTHTSVHTSCIYVCVRVCVVYQRSIDCG